MKLDAMAVAALSVAGLAVWAFMRRSGDDSTPATGTDLAYAMATSQRRESGAAQGQNTAYLQQWDASAPWVQQFNAMTPF